MSININCKDGLYNIKEETFLKASILTSCIIFSNNTIKLLKDKNIKLQNMVYNMPINSSKDRPQELIITNIDDNYKTVVSCVANNNDTREVEIDVDNEGNFIALVDGKKIDNINIDFVKEPNYYKALLSNGEYAKKYISSCGLDELNIIPWKGCAISKMCRFCGVNNFINDGEVSAFTFIENNNYWEEYKKEYINNLKEAILVAKNEECFKEHMHLILIAGNLSNSQLDLESKIFAEIAKEIFPLVNDKTTEGIVLVITPPNDLNLIKEFKKSGIKKIVFNMEVINRDYHKKYCPGKFEIGYDFFVNRLKEAVNIYGKGNVWSNLVFGLEPIESMLELCKEFAKEGIVISANILHLDKGNTLDCKMPNIYDAIYFFYNLEKINNEYGFLPFYCSKALRTSLSNEVYDKRIIKL